MAKMPAAARRPSAAASFSVPPAYRYPQAKMEPAAVTASRRSPIDPRVNLIRKGLQANATDTDAG